MANIRFAILKQIEKKNEIKIAQLPNDEYLEYDDKIFKEKLLSVIRYFSQLPQYGKKPTMRKDKVFTVDDMEAITDRAFDTIVQELKNKTVRMRSEI